MACIQPKFSSDGSALSCIPDTRGAGDQPLSHARHAHDTKLVHRRGTTDQLCITQGRALPLLHPSPHHTNRPPVGSSRRSIRPIPHPCAYTIRAKLLTLPSFPPFTRSVPSLSLFPPLPYARLWARIEKEDA